jgi:hypothetical protein
MIALFDPYEPLSEKRVFQLLDGAKNFGNFTDACSRYQEDFYLDEARILFNFAKWIDEEIGGAGPINIQELYKAFYFTVHMKVKDEKLEKIAKDWKQKLAQYA